ncbi:MAG: hypothetical protein M5U28_13700 [Sandaracinaceae bacterium]|nr:hypothetical protein [Sandaracinaceae bacterium]
MALGAAHLHGGREAGDRDRRRGVVREAIPELPSSPSPQQLTAPVAWSAQACSRPALTMRASESPVTVTGVDDAVVVPSPRPARLYPQQATAPDARTAQVKPTHG